MARLALSFLGQWQVTLDAQVVTGFESSKVRALLSYLAMETERPHYREALAGLFWPTVPEPAALASLRQALANLRKTIRDADAEPRFLLITRTTVQFNRASDVTLDVDEFSTLVARCDRHSHRRLDCCPACAGRLQQAADLYCGAFLADLYLNGTVEFETWALLQRQRLQQLAQTALGHLARYYERRGAFDAAQRTLARQLALEPWDEEAHRGLMVVLARSGRRSAALAQYQTCRRLLHEELGVAPAAETVALSEQIRRGALAEDRPGAALLNWPRLSRRSSAVTPN